MNRQGYMRIIARETLLIIWYTTTNHNRLVFYRATLLNLVRVLLALPSQLHPLIFNPRRKRYAAEGYNCLAIFVRPSVRVHGKGRLRESTHPRRFTRIKEAQWCSSVQLLPVCVYMEPTSATRLIAILCLAGQLSMQ